MAKPIYLLSARQQLVAVKNKIMWVLRPKRYSTIRGQEVKKYMATNCTIPEGWIQPVLDAQAKVFHDLLLNGHNVTLPGVGTFGLRLTTASHEKREDVNAQKDVLRQRIRFTPCSELKAELKELEFQIDDWHDKDGNIYFSEHD